MDYYDIILFYIYWRYSSGRMILLKLNDKKLQIVYFIFRKNSIFRPTSVGHHQELEAWLILLNQKCHVFQQSLVGLPCLPLYSTLNKGGLRQKNWCMARILGFLIRYFSNYYTLHRSDLAARAVPLDPRSIVNKWRNCIVSSATHKNMIYYFDSCFDLYRH